MTVMAVFQDVDKCMRCNGCVIACKREWGLKNPDNIAQVIPQRSVVNPRQRLAIKSLKRSDMGAFMRYTCWHCYDPPCVKACPLGAMKKEATGAVSVDKALCKPNVCKVGPGPKPCEFGCQRGGYPKVGVAYEDTTDVKMNKCTLCNGRAGADGVVDPATALPTRAVKDASGNWVSSITLSTGALPVPIVPELAHEPACVSSCPAKAMKWDARDNIIKYLEDPANGYTLTSGPAAGTKNWIGSGSMFWASKNFLLAPPKADPFIEDHVAPMASSMLSGTGAKLLLPTLVVGGLAALSARRTKNESEALTGGEV